MGDSTVHLVSDSESDISSAAGIRLSSNSHLSPLAHDRMGPKVISLSDNYDSERGFGNSSVE